MQADPTMQYVRLLSSIPPFFLTDPVHLQCASCHDWYRWADGLGNSPRNSLTTSPTIKQGRLFT
jgi:hypothetical protein